MLLLGGLLNVLSVVNPHERAVTRREVYDLRRHSFEYLLHLLFSRERVAH
jgi:hypothetical protein